MYSLLNGQDILLDSFHDSQCIAWSLSIEIRTCHMANRGHVYHVLATLLIKDWTVTAGHNSAGLYTLL